MNGNSNMYPEAGRHAQPEVQAAIERFRKLPAEERAKQPLLWWLTGGESTQPYKMSQLDSNYVEQSPGAQTCANCRFLYFSQYWRTNICSQIEGVGIRPEGWCRLWQGGA